MKPATLDLCLASYNAGRIHQDAHAAYWLECSSQNADHLRKQILENIEALAELFGFELTEIDEPEPEPLDAETIAQREETYRQQMQDAGRGNQLGG